MSRPITKAQLDALENVVDRVFANIGIDVEFTRHFLDRVNDERNRKQITIRELGELFAKEYKRWGREIAKMPVDTQAVMKDLSSELNIPFVLNPDGKEKDLVAKTVMRKKNFRTPNKELPVESVNETDSHFEFQGRSRGTSTWKSDDGRTVQLSTWTDYKKTGRNSRLRDPSGTKWKLQIREGGQEVFYKVVGKAEDMESRTRKQRAVNAALKFLEKEYGIDAYEQLWIEGGLPKPDSWGEVKETHGAKRGTQVKGRDATPSKRKPTKGVETPHPMRGKLVGEETVNEVSGGKVVATVNGYPIHDFGSEYPWTNKRFSIRDPRLDVWQSSAPTLDLAAKKANELSPARSPAPTMSQDQIDHENWRDEQRAKIATGEIRRAVMSRRGLGESDDESFVKQFVKEKRREGWSVYASRINHGVQGAHRLEFERNGNEFEVVGSGNHWELFHGPSLSGRGEKFDGLDTAFQTAAQMDEAMDQPPLDVPTMSVEEIADHHGVPVEQIEQQLEIGIEVEMEHTTDPDAAMEIALDHLMEMPEYYDELATVEPHHYTPESVRAAWVSYQMDEKIRDPREAMLDMALKFLDRKVHDDHDRQSLGGLAMDVAREVQLNQIGVNHRDLARLYRDWKGDTVVTEGWMEDNLYYLDEVIKADDSVSNDKVTRKKKKK